MKSFKTYLREVALGTGTAGITADGDFDLLMQKVAAKNGIETWAIGVE